MGNHEGNILQYYSPQHHYPQHHWLQQYWSQPSNDAAVMQYYQPQYLPQSSYYDSSFIPTEYYTDVDSLHQPQSPQQSHQPKQSHHDAPVIPEYYPVQQSKRSSRVYNKDEYGAE